MKTFRKFFQTYTDYSFLVFLTYGVLFIMRVWEVFYARETGSATHILNGFIGDMLVMNVVLLILYFPWKLIASYNRRVADIIIIALVAGFFLALSPVQAYYLKNGDLTNVAFFNCSLPGAWVSVWSGINILSLVFPIVFVTGWAIGFYHWVRKNKIVFDTWLGKTLLVVHILSLPLVVELGLNTGFLDLNHYRVNKPFYFVNSAIGCYAQTSREPELKGIPLYQGLWPQADFPWSDAYPLLRTHQPSPCLPQWKVPALTTSSEQLPDIVLIVVEGLGDCFLAPYKGISFMPFLENLKGESLYWENFLSTSQRRQNPLASIAGGLPYGSDGFTQLTLLPYHFSLFNVLAHNGYHTSYFTGQWNWEMATDKFLEFNNVDLVVDAGDFPAGYNKVLVGDDNYFWGYNDADLLRWFNQKTHQQPVLPRFAMIQTGSMRAPFAMENQGLYNQRFENLLQQVNSSGDREWLREKQENFTATMFTDDVLKDFFNTYSQDPRFHNTIFIITGNIPMPDLQADHSLVAYHVPLMIHSPLLTQPQVISHTASHHDLYGTLLDLLSGSYGLSAPPFTTSLGNTLCEDDQFPARAVPFLDRNGRVSEIYFNGLFLDSQKQLHQVQQGLALSPMEDDQQRLQAMLDAFNAVNNRAVTHLMPDSVFFDYFGFDVLMDTVFAGQRIRNEFRDIIRDLPVDGNRHYIDVGLRNPLLALEEVFIVFELRNEADSVVQWQNFGIPLEREDFRVRIVLEDHLRGHESGTVNLFLWNQSPVPYGFDSIRTTLYRKTR